MAATTHRYLGVDGDWANTANWDSGALPGSGGTGLDTVIIPASVSTSLTTNLDRTTDDGGDGLLLAYMHVQPGYTGNIGGSGNELKMRCTVLHYQGDGDTYFQSATGGVGLTTGRVIVDSKRGSIILSDDTTAEFHQLEFVEGTATLQASNAIDEVWITPNAGASLNTRITITNATGLIADLFMEGGELASAGQINRLHLSGGKVTHTYSNVTLGYVTGGRLLWNCATDDGALTALYLADGRVDTTQSGKEVTINTILGIGPTATLVKNDLLYTDPAAITYIGVPE